MTDDVVLTSDMGQVIRVKPLQCLQGDAEAGTSSETRQENQRVQAPASEVDSQRETKEGLTNVTRANTIQSLAPEREAVIQIMDPTAVSNNVGRTAFRFREVQSVCGHLLSRINKTVRNVPEKCATSGEG